MRLSIALTIGALTAAPLLAQTAQVDGTDGVNTLGKLPCAGTQSAVLGLCAYEALDQGQGAVTVRVLIPGGEIRYIYFQNGEPTSTNSTSKMNSTHRNAITYVFVEPSERFEIPDSVVSGQ